MKATIKFEKKDCFLEKKTGLEEIQLNMKFQKKKKKKSTKRKEI